MPVVTQPASFAKPTYAAYLEATEFLAKWHARAANAAPVLKWAGGKRRLLARYPELLPQNLNGVYYEPFLGSAAALVALTRQAGMPIPASLGDANRPLIEFYLQLREDPERVAKELTDLADSFTADAKGTYFAVRDRYNSRLPRVRAAEFLFLNRTCWNGLYRTNAKGYFNVPLGRESADRSRLFPSEDDLVALAAALSRARIRATDWSNTIADAKEGDFVFLDPPYYSDYLAGHSGTKYGNEAFGLDSHHKLAHACERLDRRNVSFVLFNSAEDELIDLYRHYKFATYVISAPRSINSVATARMSVRELLVTNLDLALEDAELVITSREHSSSISETELRELIQAANSELTGS